MGVDEKLRRLWVDGMHAEKDQSASNDRFLLGKYLKVRSGFANAGFGPGDFGALLSDWDHANVDGWDDDKLEREVARIWVRCDWAETHRRDPNRVFDDLGDEPDDRSDGSPQPAKTTAPKLRVVTARIDSSTIPTREWLIHPRLPIRDVAQCVGEPGVSNSTFALSAGGGNPPRGHSPWQGCDRQSR